MKDFESSKVIGKIGEEKAIEILKRMGYTVWDVRGKKEFQFKDIDFRVNRRINNIGKNVYSVDSPFVELEIKTDRKISKTENIFLELSTYKRYEKSEFERDKSNKKYKENGWYFKTKADVIMYYDLNNDFFYFLHMQKLREFYNRIRINKNFKIYHNLEDGGIVIGDLVSLIDLIQENICYWGYGVSEWDKKNDIGKKYNNYELKLKFGLDI